MVYRLQRLTTIPQSSRIFAENIHVEDITVFNALDDANWNVDERILMKHIQPIIGQCDDSVRSRSTEVFDAFTVQLVERYSQAFLVILDRLLGIDLADEYSLKRVLVSTAAAISTAHRSAATVYLKHTDMQCCHTVSNSSIN